VVAWGVGCGLALGVAWGVVGDACWLVLWGSQCLCFCLLVHVCFRIALRISHGYICMRAICKSQASLASVASLFRSSVVLEVRIGVATRARGAGGGRLQANELAAAVQDEVSTGENRSLYQNRSNRGCARLGGEVALPLGVVKEEVTVLVVLVR